MSDDDARQPETDRPNGWPLWVLALAIVAAALHISPFVLASMTPPEGWQFTGNVSSLSPDAMQYRVWFEETFQAGFLAENRLTGEPNTPHLPLLYFAVIGGVADAVGLSPLLLSEMLGSVWALCLVLLTYAAARRFCPRTVDLRLIVPLVVLGGGLGRMFLWMHEIPGIRGLTIVKRLITYPSMQAHLFEVYRGNYGYQALLDTHSGLQWTLAIGSLLLFHDLLRGRGGPLRMGVTAVAYALTTLIHLYTGLVLVAITVGIVLACQLRGDSAGRARVVGGGLVAAGGLTLLGVFLLLRSGGLPLADWRAPTVTFAVLAISYPLTTAALLWRGKFVADRKGLEHTFLLGWAAACLVILLSGPFFPYPDRGAITAQLPLTFLAAILWYGSGRTTTRALVLVAVVACAPSFVHRAWKSHQRVRFRQTVPAVYLGPEHRSVLEGLTSAAGTDDLLLARWNETLWLAPEHPGRHFAGHFFLTVRYDRKSKELESFYTDPATRMHWLAESGIDLVYVAAADEPARFAALEGMDAVVSSSIGTLFRFDANRGSKR